MYRSHLLKKLSEAMLKNYGDVSLGGTEHSLIQRRFSVTAHHSPGSGLPQGDGSIRRTYKTVDVQRVPEKVILHRLSLPIPIDDHTSQALAMAIGAEWEWQSERKVHPTTMPLMTLASTAVDQPKPRVFMVEELEHYIHTDPVLMRNPDSQLRREQDKVYLPLQSWAERFFSVRFNVSEKLEPDEQPKDSVSRVRQYLESLDRWRLMALHSMALDLKSLFIGMSLFNEQLSARGALNASRIEEDAQTARWGEIEGGHDLDSSVIYMKLIAASVFLKLLKPL